jgi:hypothetical protein
MKMYNLYQCNDIARNTIAGYLVEDVERDTVIFTSLQKYSFEGLAHQSVHNVRFSDYNDTWGDREVIVKIVSSRPLEDLASVLKLTELIAGDANG